MRRLVVSIHDVHPSSFAAVRAQVALCESLGVSRFSILVVPDFHGEEPFDRCEDLVTWLRTREESGDEIVLHGFYHLNTEDIASLPGWFWNRIYTTNEAEFAGIDLEIASYRIDRGRQRLLNAALHPVGFIPPAWLMNAEVARAVFEMGFSYTNTINSLIAASGKTIYSRALCYSARSGCRRNASLVWNSLLWRLKEGDDLIRLSLHPADFMHFSLREQISAILRRAIEIAYIPTTYRDVVINDAQYLCKFSKSSRNRHHSLTVFL
jgi:predicted deacetylase